MTLVEGLTISGLIIGPVAAVGISLWFDEVRQQRLRRINTLRQLLVSRINVADPGYQWAINSIPVDFKTRKKVLSAYDLHMAAAAVQIQDNTAPEERHRIHANTQQTFVAMLKEILLSEKYDEREAGFIVRGPYFSMGYQDQLKLSNDALKAVVRVADNTAKMAAANEVITRIVQQNAAAAQPANNDTT